jgi:hypothetical protein
MNPAAKSLDSSSCTDQCFSLLKRHKPCLIGLEPGLMLCVCLVTSWETPGISSGLHANISLLCWRKSTSLLSYLRPKLAPICMVLARSPASICMYLASSSVLKMADVVGIARLGGTVGIRRLSSLSSAVSSMLSYSQSSARCVLATMVMTPVGPGILSLR